MGTHADTERLMRTYSLEYAAEEAVEVPRNNVSLLRRLTMTGHDGAVVESMPPLEFGYTLRPVSAALPADRRA